MHNFWEQRLLTIATFVEEGKLPVHRSETAEAQRRAGSMIAIPASRTAAEAAAMIRASVEERILTRNAFIGALNHSVAWEASDVRTEADFAEHDRPTDRESDWTEGNVSALFRAIVKEVTREFLGMSYRLLTNGLQDVAEAIVAHLAHNLRFGPVWPEHEAPLIRLVAGGTLKPTAGALLLDYIAGHTKGGSFHRVLLIDTVEADPNAFPVMSATAWFLGRAATAAQDGDAKGALAFLSALVDGAAMTEEAFRAELHLNGYGEAMIARVMAAVRRGQSFTETMEVEITATTSPFMKSLDGLAVRVAIRKLIIRLNELEDDLRRARGGEPS